MSLTALPYWRLSLLYACYFSVAGLMVPYLAQYLAFLGFSPARIGELVAIPLWMRCVAPNLWGWVGDRFGQPLMLVRLGALGSTFTLGLIYLPGDFAWVALVLALHAFFVNAILPQMEVITLDFLGQRAERYSLIRLWGSIGFIVVVVVAGWVFEGWGFASFPTWVMLLLGALCLSSLCIPNAPPHALQVSEHGFWRQLQQDSRLWAFYGAILLFMLSHGPYYTFLNIHLESLGYRRTTLGLLWALGVAAEVVLFILMPALLRRFSVRAIFLFSLATGVVRWLLIGFLSEFLPVLLLAQLMHAATFGSFHAVVIQFIRRRFPGTQGQAQAFYTTTSGVGGALGSMIAGYVWALGGDMTFLLASAAAGLAFAWVWICFRGTDHAG